MKRILSLAALFAVFSYVSPASAEVKLGGEAAVRLRRRVQRYQVVSGVKDNEDDLKFQYRVRLKPSADLGSGYYFKGWSRVRKQRTEHLLQADGLNRSEEHRRLQP